MVGGIGRGVLAMAAALSLSGIGGVDLTPRAAGMISHEAPRAPSHISPGLPAPVSRRQDKQDRKRKKPVKKGPLTFAELLGLKARQGKRAVRTGPVYSINQAMKRGGLSCEVQNPEKYLHSHARFMAGLRNTLSARAA